MAEAWFDAIPQYIRAPKANTPEIKCDRLTMN